jgi:hypothetical protein
MIAATNLLIQIIRKDVKSAEDIVKKGMISILTPLVMEIDVSYNDVDRIELIRSTARVFSELTDI